MSAQQIKQNEIIERLFKYFDADGSGALDLQELVELFKANGIEVDRQIVERLFQGKMFTLAKFKDLNNSTESLQNFKTVMASQIERIKAEIIR